MKKTLLFWVVLVFLLLPQAWANAGSKPTQGKGRYQIQLKLKTGEAIKGNLLGVNDSAVVVSTSIDSEKQTIHYTASEVEWMKIRKKTFYFVWPALAGMVAGPIVGFAVNSPDDMFRQLGIITTTLFFALIGILAGLILLALRAPPQSLEESEPAGTTRLV
jgi:hypothetical protein